MDAAAAYMARMERLYAVNSAVAADDGNDGGGGRGGKAGAPSGDGITRVNGQAAAAVEEEVTVDLDGNRAADSDGGPAAHGDREDGDKSAAPRIGRMTTTTAAKATGRDRDLSAQGKLDHCDDGPSDRYQSGGGGETRDGSGGSGGGRGGGNSNRKKWRRR